MQEKMIEKIFRLNFSEECEKPNAKRIADAVEEYEVALEALIQKKNESRDDLWCAVSDYGTERERKGFMDGFKMAYMLMDEMREKGKAVVE